MAKFRVWTLDKNMFYCQTTSTVNTFGRVGMQQEFRNSDRILGIWYNPESGEKLNPEHGHIMYW